MHPLVDFLNHGTLPFTGRTGEADHIVEFWRGASEAPGLQALLLLGEAGMGKSRLVEEVGGMITRSGGAVIHTKLYPESATSIVPLVARALWRFNAAHPLLKTEPDESFTSILASVRRLIRLRRSVLIFEDLHLLSGEAIADFGALLDALADEQVTVLCMARPVELAARGLLERHLVGEIAMEGLGPADIAKLWENLLGSAAEPGLCEIIHRATAGNPLALRSALRGALKSKAIAQDVRGEWRTTLPLTAFEEMLVRSVELLSEGMAAHLSERERVAAGKLACLGEIFAHESACMLLGADSPMIEILAFKGIVVETGGLIPSLTRQNSARPLLAFTHTLLHRRLVQGAPLEGAALAEIIISGLPLYSIVPFQLLAAHDTPIDADIIRFVERSKWVAQSLNHRPDWKLGLEMWDAAWKVYTLSCDHMGEEERFHAEATLLAEKIQLFRRKDSTEEYRTLVEHLHRLTDRPLTPQTAIHRLRALKALYWMRSRHDYPATHAIREEVALLIERFPELRLTTAWVEYLQRVISAATVVSDNPTARGVEMELHRLEASPDAPEELRIHAFRMIAPHLLLLTESVEELAGRIAILKRLESLDLGSDMSFLLTRLTYYMNIGALNDTMRICDDALLRFREQGQMRSAAYTALVQLYCRAAFGLGFDAIEKEVLALCAAVGENAPHIREHAAVYFSLAGILRGNTGWARTIIGRLTGDNPSFNLGIRLCIALEEGNLEEVRTLAEIESPMFTSLRGVLRYVHGNGDPDTALSEAMALLALPIIHTGDVITHRIVIALLDLPNELSAGLATSLDAARHDAVTRMLERYVEHELSLYAKATLERYGRHLPKGERSAWSGRIGEIAPPAVSPFPDAGESSIALRMLGSIEIIVPGEEPNRPRGVRLRTLLGLMVADRMLDAPLSQREFCRLAAGDAQDFEDARKTVNLAVHRLREIIGHEAILTDGETPRLNLDLVDVDLLDAHHLLGEAESALRSGSFNRAFAPLSDALDITRGEVILPTLYDEFFEAFRGDFENRLRSIIIRVSKGLLRDGDAGSAEGILRRAFTAMPEDEELATILSDVLMQLGKRAEAQRIRLQAEALAG